MTIHVVRLRRFAQGQYELSRVALRPCVFADLRLPSMGAGRFSSKQDWIHCSDTMYNIRVFYPLFMPQDAANLTLARKMFRAHGMLRTSKALRLGVHPRSLYALRDSGEILKVGRGLYRLAKAPALTNPDWVTVGIRIPRAVICLISALAHHGLTTQVPHYVDIALPSHAQVPKVDAVPVRVFWFPDSAFAAGVERTAVDGVPIRIYSPEKTIADCFKYRKKIGIDVAVEALRTYRERVRKLPLNKLLEYARICRVERVMRPYLEAVL